MTLTYRQDKLLRILAPVDAPRGWIDIGREFCVIDGVAQVFKNYPALLRFGYVDVHAYGLTITDKGREALQ